MNLKEQLKITDKQKHLLIIILSLCVVLLVYYYGYNKISQKTKTIEAQNVVLGQQNQLLLQLTNNADDYTSKRLDYNEASAELIDRYPAFLQEEDMIMYVRELEMIVPDTYISYTSTPDTLAVPIEIPAREDLLVSSQDITGAITANQYINDGTYLDVNGMMLYQGESTISLLTSYDGLKDILSNVTESVSPKAIKSISIAYDEGYGMLSVSMVLDHYYMEGLGKEYTEPETEIDSTGVDAIFGDQESLRSTESPSGNKRPVVGEDYEDESVDESEEETESDTVEEEDDTDEDQDDSFTRSTVIDTGGHG